MFYITLQEKIISNNVLSSSKLHVKANEEVDKNAV